MADIGKFTFIKSCMVAGALSFGSSLSASATVSNANAVNLSQDGASVIAPTGKKISLEIGKGQLIRLNRPADSVFVANPDVADVQVKSARVIYLLAKASGETNLFALDKNDQTIFSAEISVSRNLGKVISAIESLVPEADVELISAGDAILIQGRVASPDEAASIEKLVQTMTNAKSVMNKISIMQPTQVNLRVRIAEVSRSSMKILGIRWQSLFSGSNGLIGLATGGNAFQDVVDEATGLSVRNFLRSEDGAHNIATRLTTGNLDLNAVIDALDDEGFISVLAEPNLTAVTGASADFLAGGEFPVPIPQRDGIAIEYRQFGVSLKFTPTVLDSGRINLQVEPEVSDLSTAGAIRVQGISIPSITTRRAKTTVELGSGQSFAIAGLLENETVQAASQLPGLSNIPILGALFKSKQFERNETELLIVVTPYMVRPVSDRKLALPTDGYLNPNDVDAFLKGKRWKTTPSKKKDEDKSNKGPSLKKRAGFQLD